ncbi:hypothetical protein MPSEU_000374600 [Mayamaea pseudoterrestris]|nr:hypothetical protein MPSEU_000374600 [Mayamaea pseudoterrestris]
MTAATTQQCLLRPPEERLNFPLLNVPRRACLLLLMLLLIQTMADDSMFGDLNDSPEDGKTIIPSMAPSISNSRNHGNGNKNKRTDRPTPSPTMKGNRNDNGKKQRHRPSNSPTGMPTVPSPSVAKSSSSSSASWFLYLCFIVLAALGSWIAYVYCSKKRELRMLDERSRAADRVLGDMQMLPQDEYDNEII